MCDLKKKKNRRIIKDFEVNFISNFDQKQSKAKNPKYVKPGAVEFNHFQIYHINVSKKKTKTPDFSNQNSFKVNLFWVNEFD